jgi:hypothetical protein
MVLCQAINKNNYRPCSNKARHGHTTCSSHKTFFQKDVWIKRFLYGETNDQVLLGYPEHTSSYRLEKHVRQTLASGRFPLTEEDVKRIPAVDRFSDIFFLLCELPTVNPRWNKRLLIASINYYLNLHHYLSQSGHLQNPYLLHQRRMAPILNNPHMTFGQTLKFILKVKHMKDFTHTLQHQPVGGYQTAMDALFLDYKDDYIWYSDEFLTSALVPEDSSQLRDYFKANILPKLKRRGSQIRQAKKVRLDPIKEQLVANVYHPKKVERWLNEGGWELLDMMF